MTEYKMETDSDNKHFGKSYRKSYLTATQGTVHWPIISHMTWNHQSKSHMTYNRQSKHTFQPDQ